MSSLTVEQVQDLTERINARFAEFDVEGSYVFERVTPGVARLVFDVVEEWTAQAAANKYLAYEHAIEDEEANVPNHHGRLHFYSTAPITDQDQVRADIRDLSAAYPSLEDEPNGVDIFAGVHPVTGAPELEPITQEVNIQCEPDVIESLPAPAPTNGNRHHAAPSPAAVATLGPEHTVVTPIVPRRPRTLAEVDAGDEGESKPRGSQVEREQLIAELKRQAMAGVMPTRPAFDVAKPAVWPMSQILLKRFDTTWAELADEAGLRQTRR